MRKSPERKASRAFPPPAPGGAGFLPQAMTFSLAVPLLLFLVQGGLGWNWSDEGMHWYVVRRIFHGEAPSTDFHSYAPGRYYWSAFFAWFRPDSLLAVRFAAYAFQVLGLFAGFWALRRHVTRGLDRFLLASVFALWMFPYYKIFDGALSLLAVAVAANLAEKRDPKACLAAGAAAGLSGFFGENHLLYSLVATTALLLALRFKRGDVRLGSCLAVGLAGLAIGLVPYGILAVTAPGFAASYAERLAFFASTRVQSLPLPVPWPWSVPFRMEWSTVSAYALGLAFLVLPLFYAFVVLRFFRDGKKGSGDWIVPTAAAFVGLGYLRHAWVRPDAEHLAQAAGPFLAGFAALSVLTPAKWRRWVVPVLFAYSIAAVGNQQPAVQAWLTRSGDPVQETRVGRDVLRLNANTRQGLAIMEKVVREEVRPGGTVLALPALGMMYALYDLPSPLRGVYFLFPPGERAEREMILDLETAPPDCAVLGDLAIDGREDLRFSRTHPLVWSRLMEMYQPEPRAPFWAAYGFYRWRGTPVRP